MSSLAKAQDLSRAFHKWQVTWRLGNWEEAARAHATVQAARAAIDNSGDRRTDSTELLAGALRAIDVAAQGPDKTSRPAVFPANAMMMLDEAIAALRAEATAPPAQQAETTESPAESTVDSPLLSGSELARLIGWPISPVESFLRRYRLKFPDRYVTREGFWRNESKYLYREADILPVLKDQFLSKKQV